MGSGTTSVVAKKLNRHFFGIEIEPQYCVWAEQRLVMAEDDTEIQGYVDGVFWERNSLSEQKSKSSNSSSASNKRGRKPTKKTDGSEIAVDERQTILEFGRKPEDV